MVVWRGVAQGNQAKTHFWRVPATTNGIANTGSVYAYRARCAVGRLIMTGEVYQRKAEPACFSCWSHC